MTDNSELQQKSGWTYFGRSLWPRKDAKGKSLFMKHIEKRAVSDPAFFGGFEFRAESQKSRDKRKQREAKAAAKAAKRAEKEAAKAAKAKKPRGPYKPRAPKTPPLNPATGAHPAF